MLHWLCYVGGKAAVKLVNASMLRRVYWECLLGDLGLLLYIASVYAWRVTPWRN